MNDSKENGEFHAMMVNLIAENRRLDIENTQQLARQLLDVHSAVSEMRSEVRVQKTVLQGVQGKNDQQEPQATHLDATLQDESVSADEAEVIGSPGSGQSNNALQDLSARLSTLSEGMASTASSQMLLRSLYFNKIRDRQTAIALSHQQTYQWLLDESAALDFA